MNKKEKLSDYMTDVLSVPGEIVYHMPRIVLTGDRSLFLENHNGIIHYQEDLIKIAYRGGNLEIVGENLTLPILKPDELAIEGKIKRLTFVNLI